MQAQLASFVRKVEQMLEMLTAKMDVLNDRVNNLCFRVDHLEQHPSKPAFQDLRWTPAKRTRSQAHDTETLAVSVADIELIQTKLCGPIKDVVHLLGERCLSDSDSGDTALNLLRVSSDKKVAKAVLHSEEMQPLLAMVKWSMLPSSVKQMLEFAFVKTISKKVEHTKGKVKKVVGKSLLVAAKYGKTEVPFTKDMLGVMAQTPEIAGPPSADAGITTVLQAASGGSLSTPMSRRILTPCSLTVTSSSGDSLLEQDLDGQVRRLSHSSAPDTSRMFSIDGDWLDEQTMDDTVTL